MRGAGCWCKLCPTVVTQAHRLARPAWWRHRPFLPLPDAEYLRFRLRTGYGDGGEPTAADVVGYLRWCRDFSRLRRP